MPVVGLTGGVACGKSTAARSLVTVLQSAGHSVLAYSSDDAVRKLLDHDQPVLDRIRLTFGASFFEQNGSLDKSALREEIFARPARRQALEQILHPVLRKGWMACSQEFRIGAKFYIAEIPLLYETQAESLFDCVIVVAASRAQQLQRLVDQRGWSAQTSAAVIEAQMPLAEKINRADMLLWNDFSSDLFEQEICAAAECLMIRYVR